MADIQLALNDDQMFQKAIAGAARDQHELWFETSIQMYVGFVTGLDEDWLRITETDPTVNDNRLRRIQIQRSSIITFGETGRTISSLNSKDAEAVKSYSGLFRKAAIGELNKTL